MVNGQLSSRNHIKKRWTNLSEEEREKRKEYSKKYYYKNRERINKIRKRKRREGKEKHA